jgi:orotidine-5'-phosphate decarboxylase
MMSQLIVALDFETLAETLRLVDQLDPERCYVKVGSELFTRLGPEVVQQLVNRQFKVFLDLKFHDIPNTVANACQAAADLGVWMINVHTLGGLSMMQAAKAALVSYGPEAPLLIGVTILTSLTEAALKSIGLTNSLLSQVKQLAHLAKEAGLDGVVCSAFEVKSIKKDHGSQFITVTPGIRFVDNAHEDQARVMTPREAILAGSDYLVIGRAITRASDPYQAFLAALMQM